MTACGGSIPQLGEQRGRSLHMLPRSVSESIGMCFLFRNEECLQASSSLVPCKSASCILQIEGKQVNLNLSRSTCSRPQLLVPEIPRAPSPPVPQKSPLPWAAAGSVTPPRILGEYWPRMASISIVSNRTHVLNLNTYIIKYL